MADINTMLATIDNNFEIIGKIDNNFEVLERTMRNYNNVTNNFLAVNVLIEESLNDVEDSASKAGSKFKDLTGKMKVLVGAVKNLKSVTKVLDLSDSLIISNRKLDNVNDGKQPNEELHSKVSAAAGSSGSSYKDMAGYVSKLSASGDTFKNNNQVIAFAELMQKAVVAGGTDDHGAAMNQMISSVEKGNIGSSDLKSAAGTSPFVMKALTSYTGKSEAELYKMADKGELTADNIKNAMFSMSKDINTQFKNTKMTFEETWDKLKEGALQAASGILEKINEIVSNPQIQQFVDNLIASMNIIGDAVSSICGFIITNWSIIGPILGFIGGVVLASMMKSIWEIIPELWAMVPPILAQAAAWMAANWPILLMVGALTAVITILLQMGVSFEQVCGVIGGFIGVIGAIFFNTFAYMSNMVATFGNSFLNFFRNPIASVRIMFLNLAIDSLKFIESIAKGISGLINKLTGKKINLTAGMTTMIDGLSAVNDQFKTKSGYKDYVPKIKLVDYGDVATKSYNFSANLGTKAKKGLGNMLGNNTVKDPTGNMTYQPFQEFKSLPGNSSDSTLKVEGTGADGSMNVNLPDEDKEYLKNIAERDYIANVSTNSLAPNIAVQFGDVHETADANKVAGRIKKILREQIAMASEGVY